jgi:hypothetical protein
MIVADDQQLLAAGRVPPRRIIVQAAVAQSSGPVRYAIVDGYAA